MNAIEVWQCDHCGRIWEYETEAEECCRCARCDEGPVGTHATLCPACAVEEDDDG